MSLSEAQSAEVNTSIVRYKKRLQIYTRDITSLKTTVEQFKNDPSTKYTLIAKLEAALKTLDDFSETWDKIDTQYGRLGDTTSFPSDADLNNRASLRDLIHQAQALKLKSDNETSQQHRGIDQSHNESTVFISKPQLPRISLPVFSDEMTSWTHWRDTFSSLVHDEPSLSNIQKFHHLLSSLSGEALTIVTSYKVSDINYPLAWTDLIQTYDKKRVLAYSCVDKILNFRISSPRASLSDLQGFLNSVGDNIAAFKALKIPKADDVILTFLALQSLDPFTRHQFELNQLDNEFPTTDELIKFVRNGCQAMKMSSMNSAGEKSSTPRQPVQRPKPAFPSRSAPRYNPVLYSQPSGRLTSQPGTSRATKPSSPQRNFKPKQEWAGRPSTAPDQRSQRTSDSSITKCAHCGLNHNIVRCFQFTQLTPNQRQHIVTSLTCCHNCLRSTHSTNDCPSKVNCRFCSQRHHSLLHSEEAAPAQPVHTVRAPEHPAVIVSTTCSQGHPQNAVFYANFASDHDQVLLATAVILIKDHRNGLHPVRALLDSGSTLSFITEDCTRRLGLRADKTKIGVTGLGKTDAIPISGRVSSTIHSRYNTAISVPVDALVIPHITGHLPLRAHPTDVLGSFASLQLADPDFGTPRAVDMLLGADVWNLIVQGSPRQLTTPGATESPFTTSTIFGDIIAGKLSTFPHHTHRGHPESPNVSFLAVTTEEIQEQLKKFWELEEPKPCPRLSPEDTFCEEFYKQTTSRTSSGRYVVRLPFRESPHQGNNRFVAERRFFSLENKLQRDPRLHQEYVRFMREYLDLGHMSPSTRNSVYLIPHHAVWKNEKLRVVFDASCPSPTSSLNDQLLTGPNLMKDLPDILIRFRLNPIAIVADLIKMYRQVLIHPEDRIHQHILWREDPSTELQEYELNTVTYGEASSAFLAIRTVQQIASDEGKLYPLVVKAIKNDMWVDDICTGAKTPEEARQLCQQLIGCFASGGFQLDKWSTNDPAVLPHHVKPSEDFVSLDIEDSPKIKVLGLVWNPREDIYTYSLTPPSKTATKRSILSTTARIFDPIGFLAPVVLTAKLFLQMLWEHKLSWDEPVPLEIASKWHSFTDEWDLLSKIAISRHIPLDNCKHFDIIGFSDASQRGYSAVLYIRLKSLSGEISTFLLKARSKVAPLKHHSVARLELCGALLLSNLYSSLFASYSDPEYPNPFSRARNTYLFTDSKVVMDWLNTPSHRLKVFEANRTSAILDSTRLGCWYHVPGEDNPADLATRGLYIKDIIKNPLWWSGPIWLTSEPEAWPTNQPAPLASQLTLVAGKTILSQPDLKEPDWLLRFSDPMLLFRCIARILRLRKCSPSSPSVDISAEELQNARNVCIRMVQQIAYPNSAKAEKLASLSPFLDQVGLIKVGGRLNYAPVPLCKGHPIILPPKSHLTKILVRDFHSRYFHAGPTLTNNLLRTMYWIPSFTRVVRGILRTCVTCSRRNPKPAQPCMAPLPASRFQQGRAFINVGIDFAGPFNMRDSLRRKPAITKVYLCLFICFATKALHLEAVTSLTTEAFLATLDRFVYRRGLPAAIHSDNGTNFVGASNYIRDVLSFLVKEESTISSHLSTTGIKWKFIPPHAPHFGGLWEAGVRSVKRLLPATIGTQPLTYEEYSTVFTKIEGLLNSRPLVPLSDNPDTYDVLTPAHFLIGTSLRTLPDEDLTEEPSSHLTRWQLVHSHVQHVWARWNREYLHTLQQRSKWRHSTDNIKKNQVVVLIEKKTPQGQWPIARVTDTHPGADGVIRAVTIRTSSGAELRRPVTSLSPLPVHS